MPLNSKLSVFAAGILPAIDQGADETADQVVVDAQAEVLVDTGALQTSIEKFGADGSGERTVEAGQGLDYAGIVEYTLKPFMTPAAERNRPNLARNIAARLKDLEGKCRV